MRTYWQKLKSTLFWKDPVVTSLLLIAVFGNIVGWLLVGQAEQAQAFIPWHYTVYFGIDRVGLWWQLTVYPAFAAAVLLLNVLLAAGLYHQRRQFAYMVISMAVIVQIVMIMQVFSLLLFIV